MNNYVDMVAVTNVIGNIFNKPQLLDEADKYSFIEDDFVDNFHKVVFGTIFNLHSLGVSAITLNAVEDYLEQKPKGKAVYEVNKGTEYLTAATTNSSLSTFDYYYNRMKKMTLFRTYKELAGMDLTWLYDPNNIFDAKKKQKQDEWLDTHSLQDIATVIDDRITEIRERTVHNTDHSGEQAGTNIDELIENFKTKPDFGVPLYGKFINTITRGARLKKFYLRSASANTGKTRTLVADACYVSCSEMYDINERKWVSIGSQQPSLLVAIEQDLDEIQPMMLAFISGVDEETIVKGDYKFDEEERVQKASQIIQQAPIYFKYLPDYSLKDVETTIIRNLRDHNTRYIFWDYIAISMKILEEITKRSGGVRLREDNVLFMMATRMKDLCNQYQVFLLSSTQLNADYQTSETPDQNLLRGRISNLCLNIPYLV